MIQALSDKAKELNESDRWTIINGMRVAAEEYALLASRAAVQNNARLVDQFRKQQADADRLALFLEAEEEIVIR